MECNIAIIKLVLVYAYAHNRRFIMDFLHQKYRLKHVVFLCKISHLRRESTYIWRPTKSKNNKCNETTPYEKKL